MTPEQMKAILRAQQRVGQTAGQQSAIEAAMARAQGGVSTDSQAIDEFGVKFGAMVDGAINGLSAGFSDNMAGFRGAVLGTDPNDPGTIFDYEGTMGERYRESRDAERARLEQSRQQEPTAFMAGNVAGAMGPAVASAPLATGKTAFGTAARGGVIGTVEGVAHSLGNQDSDVDLQRTAKDAAIGAGLGVAAPALVGGARMVGNAIADPITGLINKGNQSKANRAIATTVRKSGKSIDEIADALNSARAAGQPEFRAMDAMGITGQRRASGLVRSGGDGAAEIAEFLAQRQLDQGDRVAGFVDDAFDLSGGTAKQMRNSVKAGRDRVADADFGGIRSNGNPVDIRGVLSAIDEKVVPYQTADIQSPARRKLESLRKQLAGGDDPSFELSDFDKVFAIRKTLRDEIDALYRAGRNDLASDLKGIRSAMDDALSASNEQYGKAMADFAQSSRVMDAFETGQGMTRPGVRAADNIDTFSGLSANEQAAARVGYGDKLAARVEANAAPTSNNARPFNSTKSRREVDAIAVDPERFADRMARENAMWETQNKALGGSRTADNLQDIAGGVKSVQGARDVVRSLLNLNMVDAVAQAGGMLAPYGGQTDAARQLIAQAMLSRDPVKALGPAMRQDMRSQVIRRALEGMLRGGSQQGIAR